MNSIEGGLGGIVSPLYMDYQQIYDNSVQIFHGRLPHAFDENNDEHLLILEECIMEILTKSMQNIVETCEEEFEDLKNQILSTINMAFQIGFKEGCLSQKCPPVNMVQQMPVKFELSQEEIQGITEQVRAQFQKAFWDKLADDLSQVPVKSDQLIVLFSEILDRLDRLTPHNLNYLHDNHDQLSPGILKSQIVNGVFRPEYLDGIVEFIVIDRLKRYISSADNQEFQQWSDELFKVMHETSQYSVTVPLIFQGIYKWLDRIEQQIQEFNASLIRNYPHLFKQTCK